MSHEASPLQKPPKNSQVLRRGPQGPLRSLSKKAPKKLPKKAPKKLPKKTEGPKEVCLISQHAWYVSGQSTMGKRGQTRRDQA
ncbi:hypothetical protein E4U59_004822 [Claviceps monticola]|nr:hypothetical protein E4U59_004822 [Claviceps monticola]